MPLKVGDLVYYECDHYLVKPPTKRYAVITRLDHHYVRGFWADSVEAALANSLPTNEKKVERYIDYEECRLVPCLVEEDDIWE